jgi:Fe-S cluster assembly iron-binding protein IscA
LPWRLTDGHHVYLSSTMVHRSRLPGGVLAAPILPLVVAPGVSDVSMVLPLSCWSPTLIQAWPTLHEMTTDAAELATRKVPDAQLAEDERDARDRPHRALSAEDLVSGASQASVTLTANCAAVVRDLARQHKLRGRWWLKLGGSDGAWTLDMATSCDATEYLCVESRGVLILIPRRKRGEFQGLVVDFKETTIGAGFVFYSSSSSSL